MNLTISSILTTFIISCLLILMLWLFCKNNFIIKKLGIWSLIAVIAVIAIRNLVPYEFEFSNNINIYWIYPKIYDFLRFKIEPFFLYQMLVTAWIIGTIIYLISKMVDNRRFCRCLNYIVPKNLDSEKLILSDTLDELSCSKKIRLIRSPMVSSPAIYGIKKPTIVIPNIKLSDEYLHNIFMHEIQHYISHDLYKKAIVQVICAIFWWNPFIYLFRSLSSKSFEIFTDLEVTKNMDEHSKIKYLETLLYVCKNSVKNESITNPFAIALVQNRKSALKQRFKLVLEYKNKANLTSLLCAVFMCILMVLSMYFVFEPYYPDPNYFEEEGIFQLKDENSYFVKNADNSYDLFLNNEMIYTVTEFETVQQMDIPIVTK